MKRARQPRWITYTGLGWFRLPVLRKKGLSLRDVRYVIHNDLVRVRVQA